MMTDTIRDTHRLAMALTDYAGIARRYEDMNVATELLQRALYYERQAADTFAAQYDDALWRAVLYRSAASLAMQCGEYGEAERLIETGLQGNPPKDIAQELHDLLEQVASLRQASLQEQHSELEIGNWKLEIRFRAAHI